MTFKLRLANVSLEPNRHHGTSVVMIARAANTVSFQYAKGTVN